MNDRSVDGSERILDARELADANERILKLRKDLSSALISCHDARMIRNALIVILDLFLPEKEKVEEKEIVIPVIRAHSEVVIKEPIERIDKGDGTEIRQERTKIVP